MSARLAVGAGAWVLLLTACSGSVSVGARAVSADELADALGSRITGDDGADVEVSCEDDLPAEVDATVDCTATDADGARTGIRPVVTSVDGDDVAYDAPLFLPGEELADQLRGPLEQQGYAPDELACDEVAGEVGATGTCTARMAGAGEPVELTITIREVDGLRFRFGYASD